MKTFKNYLEQVQGINEAFSEDFEDDYRDDFMALIGPYLSTKQFDLVLNLTHEWHA